jgi:hypothetical protein
MGIGMLRSESGLTTGIRSSRAKSVDATGIGQAWNEDATVSVRIR